MTRCASCWPVLKRLGRDFGPAIWLIAGERGDMGRSARVVFVSYPSNRVVGWSSVLPDNQNARCPNRRRVLDLGEQGRLRAIARLMTFPRGRLRCRPFQQCARGYSWAVKAAAQGQTSYDQLVAAAADQIDQIQVVLSPFI
jgi:hypothetical protein